MCTALDLDPDFNRDTKLPPHIRLWWRVLLLGIRDALHGDDAAISWLNAHPRYADTPGSYRWLCDLMAINHTHLSQLIRRQKPGTQHLGGTLAKILSRLDAL